MSSLSASDLATIVAAIGDEFDDASTLAPEGSTVAAWVDSRASRVLDEINIRIGAQYPAQGGSGDLPAAVMTVVIAGCLWQFLRQGYRVLSDSERAWMESYQDQFERMIAAIAAGDGELPGAETDARSLPRGASQPRIMTYDADQAATIAAGGGLARDLNKMF